MRGGWTAAPAGFGKAYYGGGLFGVPAAVPVWRIARVIPGVMSMVCLDEARLYIAGATDLAAVSVDDGSVLWKHTPAAGLAKGMAINRNLVLAGVQILDAATGSLLADIPSLYPDLKVAKHGISLPWANGFIRQISVRPPVAVFCSPTDRRPDPVDQELASITAGANGQVVGVADGRLVARQVDTGRIAWEVGLPTVPEAPSPPALCVQSGQVFVHCAGAYLLAVDATSGAGVWHVDAPDSAGGAFDRLMAAPDRLYLVKTEDRNGSIACFDASSGQPVWERPAPLARASCVAGDLVFLSVDDSALIALDRYTGNPVWQAEERMGPAYHVVAAGSHVVFSTTTDEMRCFRWGRPYQSPGRSA